ncbi:hypothetical protein [Methanoregula sp.]|uniref:hypothetical protein n=1 Tax=Methanoregula sp. TaxID=2052170 RepID=UPI002CE84907|nr:hypothetical protein [Methanoregula sp.]HVP97624.1 hypothetical protein [Methanoregula sp.]
MINIQVECPKILARSLVSYGYTTENLKLLGNGSEGAVYSTNTHIFKIFFDCRKTISEEKLAFISKNFRANEKISGVRQLSDIITDHDVLIFITPYESYTPYRGGDVENVLAILVDAKHNDYIYTNFHPKNLMYDTSHKLRIIDVGRSLESYNENGYGNMIRRAFLSTYFFQRSDLVDLMSSLHRPGEVRELIGIDKFLEKLSSKLQSKIEEN